MTDSAAPTNSQPYVDEDLEYLLGRLPDRIKFDVIDEWRSSSVQAPDHVLVRGFGICSVPVSLLTRSNLCIVRTVDRRTRLGVVSACSRHFGCRWFVITTRFWCGRSFSTASWLDQIGGSAEWCQWWRRRQAIREFLQQLHQQSSTEEKRYVQQLLQVNRSSERKVCGVLLKNCWSFASLCAAAARLTQGAADSCPAHHGRQPCPDHRANWLWQVRLLSVAGSPAAWPDSRDFPADCAHLRSSNQLAATWHQGARARHCKADAPKPRPRRP